MISNTPKHSFRILVASYVVLAVPSKSRRCTKMKPSLRARGTLKDVAKIVGVSHTTVSNAFNRPNQLSTKVRESVLAAARSINYSGRNPAARMLRIGFAKTLLLCGLIQWLTLLKIRPRCPSFPEWPKHVPGTSQLASFAGRGHGWLAL